MVKILLVGDARSIFFVKYVEAIKRKMDVEISVYCPFPQNDWYKKFPYDYAHFDNFLNTKFYKIRFFGYFFSPFIQYVRFLKFLLINKKKYDIIHIHWALPAWVVAPQLFKCFCNKMGVTLWGGELEHLRLLMSRKLYLHRLGNLLKVSDFYIDVPFDIDDRVVKEFPFIKGKSYGGIFGSSIIEILTKSNLNPQDCKQYYSIPLEKISVLLGYSGKVIHNHIKIIHNIVNCPSFSKYKDKIHFIASMTRGASPNYIKEVETNLEMSGVSYTVVKNCYQSDLEVAKLRLATDIFLQLTDFDGFSASVKEGLCAGSLLICGEWLNYRSLKREGFFFIDIPKIEQIGNSLFHCINQFPYYNTMKNQNYSLCDKKYSWDSCIEDWIKCYKEQLINRTTTI